MSEIKGASVETSGKVPPMVEPETVSSAKNINGQTQPVSSTKDSDSAGFSASRKAGSVKGDCSSY